MKFSIIKKRNNLLLLAYLHLFNLVLLLMYLFMELKTPFDLAQ